MRGFLIRPFSPKDARGLLALLREFREEGGKKMPEAFDTAVGAAIELLSETKSRQGICLVAEDEAARLAGYLNGHFLPFLLMGGEEFYVSELVVRREVRNQGIGRALLASAEAAAAERGAKRIMLNNLKDTEAYARGFYPGLGYRERTEAANMVKNLGRMQAAPVERREPDAKATRDQAREPGLDRETAPIPETARRFDGRVDAYRAARPGYPPQVAERIVAEPGCRILELGSGTGIFTRLLADRFARVYALEPNDQMRAVLEQDLAEYTGVSAHEGSAEATGFGAAEFDSVVCAQSFHWFANAAAVAEMKRVLKPRGRVWLVWNSREEDRDDFHRELEALFRRVCPDYRVLKKGREIGETEIGALFEPWVVDGVYLDAQEQVLDRQGFFDRVHSASYWPSADQAGSTQRERELGELFDRHQREGKITLKYKTRSYRIGEPG